MISEIDPEIQNNKIDRLIRILKVKTKEIKHLGMNILSG